MARLAAIAALALVAGAFAVRSFGSAFPKINFVFFSDVAANSNQPRFLARPSPKFRTGAAQAASGALLS